MRILDICGWVDGGSPILLNPPKQGERRGKKGKEGERKGKGDAFIYPYDLSMMSPE
jgi:hypothetical protein